MAIEKGAFSSPSTKVTNFILFVYDILYSFLNNLLASLFDLQMELLDLLLFHIKVNVQVDLQNITLTTGCGLVSHPGN